MAYVMCNVNHARASQTNGMAPEMNGEMPFAQTLRTSPTQPRALKRRCPAFRYMGSPPTIGQFLQASMRTLEGSSAVHPQIDIAEVGWIGAWRVKAEIERAIDRQLSNMAIYDAASKFISATGL
jgi:hypothetical protein